MRGTSWVNNGPYFTKNNLYQDTSWGQKGPMPFSGPTAGLRLPLRGEAPRSLPFDLSDMCQPPRIGAGDGLDYK